MSYIPEEKLEQIEKLKKDMYSVYGVADGVLLSKEHNMIKWFRNSLGSELFDKVYDEYFEWLKSNTTPEQIKEEKTIISFKSMMDSCFTYDGLTKDNDYIKKYRYELGVELFNKVYDEHSKHLNENYIVNRDVYTDHEGCTYNSLIKM